MSVYRTVAALGLLVLGACNGAQSDEQYYAYRCSEVRGIKPGSPGYDTCIGDERYWLDFNRHMHGGAGP